MLKKEMIGLLSLFFAVALLLGGIPLDAFAAEPIPADNSAIASVAPLSVPENHSITPFSANATEYYGRAALSQLPNAQALLYAYDQIAVGIESSAATIEVFNGIDPISQAEIQMVVDAYRRDYAHHFWLGNQYAFSYTPYTVLMIQPSYLMTGSMLETAKEEMEDAAHKILSGITPSMSEYQKELYIHDQLAAQVTYNESSHAHDAYGALVEGIAVCEGYAEAFQYLLQCAGIQSFIATGSSINPATGRPENHAWNYVRIDGNYYHVDLTWNDQENDVFHMYFNQTDTVMGEDHYITPTAYALPVCDADEAFYFNGKAQYLESYTTQTVGALLKNHGSGIHVYIPENVDAFLSWYYANIVAIATEAGVSGGFSYGYTRLGRELILIMEMADHVCKDNLTAYAAKDASCTTSGNHAYYRCSCGKYYQDALATIEIGKSSVEIPAQGHTHISVVTPPTCTAQGYTTHTCHCGDSFVDSYEDAKGHAFGDWYETIAPEATTSGEERRDCADCDHFETQEIPAIGTIPYGDANGDSIVNGKDVLLLRKYMANYDYDTESSSITVESGADANGDGMVNGKDVLLMRKYMANYDYDSESSSIVLGPTK